ncbi:hypothetical protein INT45_003950 [Circinella minor]|uniref:Uncharacterized protein n=1 Tax=Circinella minor TaxID=1195481 RepID=A0A8H7RYG9_9FUNG|nr:hypothetical protein INT45_003950 [Circinella minor]
MLTRCTRLKTKLSTIDREKVLKVYDALLLDESTCWVLKVTKRQAIIEERTPWSVERKMREFVATLTYVQPSLSLILNTDDLNWVDYFNKEELNELKNSGQPLLQRVHSELKLKFEEIEKLVGLCMQTVTHKSALDVYNYGRLIDHHSVEQPLLAWLSQTLMQIANFFIPGAPTSTQNMLEIPLILKPWISKRKLSAVDEIERERLVEDLIQFILAGALNWVD